MMAEYGAYTTYKNSGIEWLGEIPTHWESQRLKWSHTACQNGIWGDEPDGGVDDIACVRVADFDRVKFRIDMSKTTFRSVDGSHRMARKLELGDLLLEKSGGGEN